MNKGKSEAWHISELTHKTRIDEEIFKKFFETVVRGRVKSWSPDAKFSRREEDEEADSFPVAVCLLGLTTIRSELKYGSKVR